MVIATRDCSSNIIRLPQIISWVVDHANKMRPIEKGSGSGPKDPSGHTPRFFRKGHFLSTSGAIALRALEATNLKSGSSRKGLITGRAERAAGPKRPSEPMARFRAAGL